MSMEEQIYYIVEKAWEEMEAGCGPKTTLKLAVLDAYKAGMEAAKEIYTEKP